MQKVAIYKIWAYWGKILPAKYLNTKTLSKIENEMGSRRYKKPQWTKFG